MGFILLVGVVGLFVVVVVVGGGGGGGVRRDGGGLLVVVVISLTRPPPKSPLGSCAELSLLLHLGAKMSAA